MPIVWIVTSYALRTLAVLPSAGHREKAKLNWVDSVGKYILVGPCGRQPFASH